MTGSPPDRASSIFVVGAGYVGLATAVSFAHLGHRVTAVEIDELRLALLEAGEPPFLELGMQEMLAEGLGSGRLTFVAPDEAAYGEADLVFLCLPTPQGDDGAADLTALYAAVRELAPLLRSGAIVVDKSTVPVGTTRRIAAILDRSDVSVVSNPEFLQEGAAIDAFLHADRVVVGADDPAAAARVARLYADICPQPIVTGIESAELAKYACNAFLAAKLSFVNSMAALCDFTGADIGEVAAVMGSDPRIGDRFLTPGPGWGGSCFPKDVSALIATAAQAGLDLGLLRAAVTTNRQTFDLVVAAVAGLCGDDLDGKRIAVWGLTFKAGTDDVRDSAALAVITRLRAAGAEVCAFDPAVNSSVVVETAADAYEAVTGAEALVVLTEWPAFRSVDLVRVARLMARPALLDTRGVIDRDRARRAGFEVRAIGHPMGSVPNRMAADGHRPG